VVSRSDAERSEMFGDRPGSLYEARIGHALIGKDKGFSSAAAGRTIDDRGNRHALDTVPVFDHVLLLAAVSAQGIT
jgi:hypothetical protein